MATTAGTAPADVRAELDTDLGDPDLNTVLSGVERDIDREYASPGFDDDQHRQDFEAALAALRVALGNAPDAQDRTASEVQTGRSSVTYEASVVATLRQRVRRRDSGDAFGRPGTVIRDTNRHTTATDL